MSEARCQHHTERDARLAALEETVAELRREVQELRWRLDAREPVVKPLPGEVWERVTREM